MCTCEMVFFIKKILKKLSLTYKLRRGKYEILSQSSFAFWITSDLTPKKQWRQTHRMAKKRESLSEASLNWPSKTISERLGRMPRGASALANPVMASPLSATTVWKPIGSKTTSLSPSLSKKLLLRVSTFSLLFEF